MAATSLHLFSGWGFPRESLDALADLLRATIPTYAHDALDDLPDVAGLGGAILAGWSLGALRVLESACLGAAPAGLVLIAGTARFCSRKGYTCGTDERVVRSMLLGLQRDAEKTIRSFLHRVAERGADADHFVDRHTPAAISVGERDLKRGLALLRDTDIRDGVAACPAPLLLLHGTDDRIVPFGAAEWIHDALPTSKLIAKAGAGHDLPLRHPEWVADQIREFVRAIS